MKVETVRPDSKGRITLGSLTKGVSSYKVSVDEITGYITLQPFTEIPMRERWLRQNTKALASVLEGIKQSADGQVTSLGDFIINESDDKL